MNMHEADMRMGKPTPLMLPEHDVIIEVGDFNGTEYDNMIEEIMKASESSRSISSFISLDFRQLTRFMTMGRLGHRCYEGIAEDTKGRIWFLKIIDEYRAYHVGMEAEDILKAFLAKYVPQLQ